MVQDRKIHDYVVKNLSAGHACRSAGSRFVRNNKNNDNNNNINRVIIEGEKMPKILKTTRRFPAICSVLFAPVKLSEISRLFFAQESVTKHRAEAIKVFITCNLWYSKSTTTTPGFAMHLNPVASGTWKTVA